MTSKDAMEKKIFSTRQIFSYIGGAAVFLFACGATYSSVDGRLEKNSESVISNTELIEKLDTKIDTVSVNDRALTYKYSSAQKARIDEMQKILNAQEKRDARIEVHLEYMVKSLDELKELQKKK